MNYKEITTLEAIHARLNLDPVKSLPDVSMMPAEEGENTINSILFERMIKVINMDDDGNVYEPDYTDGQPKINPYHEVKASKEQPGGFAFSDSYYASWHSDTIVGSRRCFRDVPRFWHALEHFEDLFIKTLLIVKK